MKSDEVRVLGELHYRGKRMAFRLFKDWATWDALKDEFRKQYAIVAKVGSKQVNISAWKLNVEV